MKNFIHFRSQREQLDFVWDTLIIDRIFYNTPFYRNLVEWVVENRAPFFFHQSKPYEYAHFSQYWQGFLIRDGVYENATVQSMYYLHDFTHNLFYATFKPRNIPIEFWTKILKANEYVSSDETEIMIYYRVPGLRQKTFEYPIMYDKITSWSPEKPSVEDLVDLRTAMAHKTFVWNIMFTAAERETFKKSIYYHTGHTGKHWAWRGLWYPEFPELRENKHLKSLTYDTYEAALTDFVPANDERQWQTNYAYNIQFAVEMTTGEYNPLSFGDCERALSELENTVIMDHAAREYHPFYLAYL